MKRIKLDVGSKSTIALFSVVVSPSFSCDIEVEFEYLSKTYNLLLVFHIFFVHSYFGK